MISDYLKALQLSTDGKLLRLPSSLLRLAISRIVFKLGPRPYSLFRLWSKEMSTWSSYLDDSPLKPTLRAFSSSLDRELVVDKMLFYKECIKHNLPTVPIVGIFRQSLLGDQASGLPVIADSLQLQKILVAHPYGLFFKPYAGTHGVGAFAVIPCADGWNFPAGVSSVQGLFEYCVNCAANDILLVQPRLINAASIRTLMADGGFGTVRAVTYMDGGEPRLLSACLRLIVAGNAADNFSQGSSGNFVAPIDSRSGRLITLRASRSRTWPEIYDTNCHPVNSVPITGFEIAHWDECIELMFRAQQVFSRLHSIGWDIGITESGPILIEGNAQYDLDLLQVAFDRGFRPDLMRVVTAHQNQRPKPFHP